MKDIREQLDIGQVEMSQFLGLSRSHYSMFENGNRNLPKQVELKSTLTKLAFYKIKPTDFGTTENEQTETVKKLRDLIEGLNLKIRRYERRLQELINKVEANQRKRRFVVLMREAFPEPDPATAAFINLCESGANYELKISRYAKIEELKIDIELLKEKVKRLAAIAYPENGE